MGKCALSGWVTTAPVLTSAGVHYCCHNPFTANHNGLVNLYQRPVAHQKQTFGEIGLWPEHPYLCARQLLSAKFQYKGDIFHLKDRKQLVVNRDRFFLAGVMGRKVTDGFEG